MKNSLLKKILILFITILYPQIIFADIPEPSNNDLKIAQSLVLSKNYVEADHKLDEIMQGMLSIQNHLLLSDQDIKIYYKLKSQVACMLYGSKKTADCFTEDYKYFLEDFKSILKYDPNNKIALENVAFLSYLIKDYSNSIIYFKEYLKKFPNSIKAEQYSQLSECFFKLGDYNNALIHINNAIKLDPNNQYLIYNRGIYKRLQGDLWGAVIDYNTIISQNSSQDLVGKSYRLRGEIRVKIGDFRGAIQDYEKSKNIFLDGNQMKEYEMTLNRMEVIKELQEKYLPWPLSIIQVFLSHLFQPQ